MEYLFKHLSNKILSILHQLEFDKFMLKKRRASLLEELSSLIEKRNNLINLIEEDKESKN